MKAFDSDDTIASKNNAVSEFLQSVATAIHSGSISVIERGLIINRLAKILSIDSKDISAEIHKNVARMQRNASFHVKNQKVVNTDLGKGLAAAAQREILEVLLNEPNLFENVKDFITVDAFNVPILGVIANILFDMLDTDPNFSLTDVLAKIESVEVAGVVVQLAQAGEEKGEFLSRLTGAANIINRHHTKKNKVGATEDQTQYLRGVCENTERKNPHNLGMI